MSESPGVTPNGTSATINPRPTVTSHAEITGDFDSAYVVTTEAKSDKGPEQLRDTTTRIEAKWLGDCKPGQKPGDVVMPGGGFRLNVKDVQKLRIRVAPGGDGLRLDLGLHLDLADAKVSK